MAQFTAPHGLPRRGQTFYKGQTPPTTFAESRWAEGTMAQFKEYTDAGAVGADSTTTNNAVLCRLVRNVSGITLEGKRLVTWAAGHIGKRVDGYATTDYNADVAGVLDERLTSGCPANDMCWMVVQGPTLVKSALSDYGADLAALGRVAAITAATSQATTAGRIQPFSVTSSYTTAATETHTKILGIIGRAISGRTTNNTDADVLCYIDLLKA
jgi:hypothetical protein